MDTSHHSMHALFEQLGLPSSAAAINHFIAEHHHAGSGISIDAYPFWTPSQAAFLKEAVEQDADWAEVVDELNACLHS